MRGLAVATVVCLATCALLLVLRGPHLMTAVAIVLGGTAFVLVLAMVFYAVGRSEDRERAARECGSNDPSV